MQQSSIQGVKPLRLKKQLLMIKEESYDFYIQVNESQVNAADIEIMTMLILDNEEKLNRYYSQHHPKPCMKRTFQIT